MLGFSFSGDFIPAGSGVLTVLSFEGSGEACLSNIIVAGADASNLDTASGDCVTIDETCDSGIYDCAGVCDGTAVEDCAGECGGDAVVDECGECGGDGSSCGGTGVFGLALNDDGNLDVTYSTTTPIFGFQFDISNVSITSTIF